MILDKSSVIICDEMDTNKGINKRRRDVTATRHLCQPLPRTLYLVHFRQLLMNRVNLAQLRLVPSFGQLHEQTTYIDVLRKVNWKTVQRRTSQFTLFHQLLLWRTSHEK